MSCPVRTRHVGASAGAGRFARALAAGVGLGRIAVDRAGALLRGRVRPTPVASDGGLFRAVVDTTNDAIVLADRRGVILSFNPAAETIFGYAEHELLGRNVHVLMPPDQQAAHERHVTRYDETRIPHVVGIGRLVEGRRKDGTLFPLHLSMAEWSNGAGTVGFIAVLRDDSEHRRARQALAESEGQFRLFMDCATDYAICQLDLDDRIVKWNKGTESILGYGADELDGFDIKRLFPPDEARAGGPDGAAAPAEFGRQEAEGWLVRGDGRRFWASGVIRPILDGQAKLVGKAVILRDMSEQRAVAVMLEQAKDRAETAARVESQLRSAIEASNQELKAANEGLQQFTSIIAHDLRAPLKRIDAFIGALREDYAERLDEDGREILTRINRGAVRIQLMLDSLLDYSRYNAKAITGKTADIAAVVGGVIESCDFRRFESCIHVHAAGAPRIEGDPILLAHVFQNLIANSVKFRKGDDLRIDIAVTSADEVVHVSITDNGIGIEPHFADKVFDMFYRLHDEDEYEGTGIGLTVCRKIVHDHGGRIWVEKDHVGGTSINLTLRPATGGEQAGREPPAPAPRMFFPHRAGRGIDTIRVQAGL